MSVHGSASMSVHGSAGMRAMGIDGTAAMGGVRINRGPGMSLRGDAVSLRIAGRDREHDRR